MSAPALIPVHILTGFLGSGKTTLLNRALRAGFGAETAVVINEFGDVGLDQLFVQTRSDETVVLKSGCVCCMLRSDLPATLLGLLAAGTGRESPFRRIVIETSGISEPLPILQTLRGDPALRARFSAGAIVCTASALDDRSTRERPEAHGQITAADALVMTKCDLAGVEDADEARVDLEGLNPLADWVGNDGAALARWLADHEGDPSVGRTGRPLRLPGWPPAARTSHRIRSIVIRAAPPASWPRFAVWLTRLIHVHGDRILRTKGVLLDVERGAWIGIHGVKRFFHPPVHLSLDFPPEDGTTLVFITDGLDPTLIERSYRNEVADDWAAAGF